MPTPATSTAPHPVPVLQWVGMPLFLVVLLCFFLPLVELTCAGESLRFSGVNLAIGTDPSPSEGFRPLLEEVKKERLAGELGKKSKEAPGENLPFLLVPLLAITGLWLAWNAFQGRAPEPAWTSSAVALALSLVFAYYAATGFAVERQFKKELANPSSSNNAAIPVAMGKTPWFYLSFACSTAALGSSLYRPRSKNGRLDRP